VTPLNLDPWWDEPAYKAAIGTFTERAAQEPIYEYSRDTTALLR
jgi:hypothetical protein